MSSGSLSIDNRVPVVMYVEGSYQNTTLAGWQHTKTWSGGDSRLPRSPEPFDPGRLFTTVSPSGRRYRFYARRAPRKREKLFSPNNYSMSALRRFNPLVGDMANNLSWNPQHYTNATLESVIGVDSVTLPAPPPFDANDDIKLISRLKDRIGGSDFNMSVFLAEGHQVVGMIGDTAVKLARAYHLFRRGDVVGSIKTMYAGRKMPPKAFRRKSANNWLELQYGWLPLLGDMKDGAELLAHRLNVPFRQRHVVRMSKSASKQAMDNFNVAYRWSGGRSVVQKQIVAFISEPESLPSLLGLMDPELIAWELTPFSFVVDWFLPVGDYLAARAFASRLHGTFVITTKTTMLERGIEPKVVNYDWVYPGATGVWDFGNSDAYSRERVTLLREVTNSLVVPMPKVKPLDEALSWQHCLNGIALLANVLHAPKKALLDIPPPALSAKFGIPNSEVWADRLHL